MTTPFDTRRRAHLALAAVVSGIGIISLILYKFPPEKFGFYPPCPFHEVTGLLCPGCGATRALAALVHGNITAAMQWNGLFVVLLPVLFVYAAMGYLRAVRGLESLRVPTSAIATLLAISIGFGVLRNLF